jgi:hypothetical protein
MAAYSIPDRKNIRPLQGALIRQGVISILDSEEPKVGHLVHIVDTANGVTEFALADGTELATAIGVGVIVASGHSGVDLADGDAISVVTLGPVSGFASLNEGAVGFTSDTAGAIDTAAGTVTWRVGYNLTDEIFFVLPGFGAPSS